MSFQSNNRLFVFKLSEIGIDDKFVGVSKNADAASRRYIYYKDEVLELPTGFALMKKWGPLPRSLMGLMMREPLIGHTNGDEDVSVHEFFRKRFQCEEVSNIFQVIIGPVFPAYLQPFRHKKAPYILSSSLSKLQFFMLRLKKKARVLTFPKLLFLWNRSQTI